MSQAARIGNPRQDAPAMGAGGWAGTSVAARMDALPLSRLHVAITLLCALGMFADIAEVAVGNVLAAVFLAPPYSMARADLSLLLAAVYVGGAIGSPVVGALADRFGRRRLLQLSLVAIAVTSLASAATRSVGELAVCRFAVGLAIGAYPPLTSAFLSDILPPGRRGPMMMVCGGLAFLGAPAVILLIRHLPAEALGLDAWRWGLVAAGATALVAAAFFALVPESPRALKVNGRAREAEAAYRRFARSAGLTLVAGGTGAPSQALARPAVKLSMSRLVRDPRLRGRTLLLLLLYLLGPWATLGFPLLSGAAMVGKGFAVSDSVLFAGLSMLGPAIGVVACAVIVDRLDRRLVLVLCTLAMIALGFGFVRGTDLTELILIGIAFNLVAAIFSAVLAVYGAEMFPTELRGSANGWAWSVSRLVSIVVAPTLLTLLGLYGPSAMFAAITAALLASIVLVVWAGPPGLARRAID